MQRGKQMKQEITNQDEHVQKEKKVITLSKKQLIVCIVAVAVIVIAAIVIAFTVKKNKEIAAYSGKDYKITNCIKLGKYKGIKVSLAATDDDIQSEIENLQEEYTTYEEKKGTAKDGDKVYADFAGYVNGALVEAARGSDYIDIGSGEWIDGFEEAFIGMKTGKTKKVKIDVPEGTYGEDSIDGKTVEFKLTLHYICGDEIVPDFTDDFVQSISDYNTVSEYKAYLKEKLEKENQDDKEEYAWTEVLDAAKVTKYPKSLMKSARQEVLQGYYDMADLYGQSHDEIFQSFGCDDEADFKKTQLDDLAKDTVKEALTAQAVAYEEKITYTKADYNKLVQEEYESNSGSYKSQQEYKKKNKDYLERTALQNAVKAWISKRAKFTK